MKLKKEKLENFKCLNCGNFFKKTKLEFEAFLDEQKDLIKHPNDFKFKILCPNCQSHIIQHLDNPQKQIINRLSLIKENYNSLSSFLGSLIGNIFGLFLISWEENQFILLKRFFSLFGFCVVIFVLNKFFNIDSLYSVIASLVYLFIIKIR